MRVGHHLASMTPLSPCFLSFALLYSLPLHYHASNYFRPPSGCVPLACLSVMGPQRGKRSAATPLDDGRAALRTGPRPASGTVRAVRTTYGFPDMGARAAAYTLDDVLSSVEKAVSALGELRESIWLGKDCAVTMLENITAMTPDSASDIIPKVRVILKDAIGAGPEARNKLSLVLHVLYALHYGVARAQAGEVRGTAPAACWLGVLAAPTEAAGLAAPSVAAGEDGGLPRGAACVGIGASTDEAEVDRA